MPIDALYIHTHTLPSPSPLHTHVYTFTRQELYEGEAAVAAHEGTDRMQALLPKLEGLCKSLRLVHGMVAAETLG